MNEIAKQHSISTTTCLKHVKNLLSGIFRYAIRTGSLNTANPIRLLQGDQKVLAVAGQPWHRWQAACRGLATILHQLKVQDITIQAI
jgi:hypothetical protein